MVVYNPCGGENGPVTVAAFKAADSALRGSNGGFDSHTPPPHLTGVTDVTKKRDSKRQQKEILGAVLVPIQAAARTVAAFLDLDVQSRRISIRYAWMG